MEDGQGTLLGTGELRWHDARNRCSPVWNFRSAFGNPTVDDWWPILDPDFAQVLLPRLLAA